MEYIVLLLILIGAVWMLFRFGKTETECHHRADGCAGCPSATLPPADRLYHIDCSSGADADSSR